MPRFNAITLLCEACSTQSSCDASSEKWKGDDNSLPHSARRCRSEQRLAQKEAVASPTPLYQLPLRHSQLFPTVEEGHPCAPMALHASSHDVLRLLVNPTTHILAKFPVCNRHLYVQLLVLAAELASSRIVARVMQSTSCSALTDMT